MTELHPSVRSTLEAIAPRFDDVPAAWEDAVRRSAEPATRPRRQRTVVIAIALGVVAGLAASPFGQAVVRDTLSELGAWADDEPGDPASPNEQRAFDADNAASYASFPTGTRVGVLVRTQFDGQDYTLYGFRDGEALCVRLLPTRLHGDRSVAAECVPRFELARLDQPLVVLARSGLLTNVGERCTTAVYGLASADVAAVRTQRPAGATRAALGNNAFLSIADGPDCVSNAPTSVTAVHTDGTEATIPIPDLRDLILEAPEAAQLPGPAEVDRRLADGSVGWLQRGEARGEAFAWPGESGQDVVTSRLLRPNPDISFRLGVGFKPGDEHGDWYCIAHLWPLIKDPMSHMCTRVDWVQGGVGIAGAWPNETQFPLHVGLVADDVATLEVYYESGERRRIPIVENAFAFQAPAFEHVKLVARDADGLVVKILVL
jgi:hypothetical protein